MSNKLLIQIAIMLAAFGGSGIVLYRGITRLNMPAALRDGVETSNGEAGLLSSDKVLPYGDSLDFNKVLNMNNLQYGTVRFPKLQMPEDVGVSEKDLIKPVRTAGKGKK